MFAEKRFIYTFAFKINRKITQKIILNQYLLKKTYML